MKNNITAKVELITPEKAAALFDAIPEYQRNLRPTKVAQYASDMELGLWSLNGEPLIIASNGDLIDGQHRIAAIVKANKPIEMMVVRGVEPQAFKTIDKGLARTAADCLKGTPSAKNVATIARAWLAYTSTGKALYAFNNKMSPVQVQEYALEHVNEILKCRNAWSKCSKELGNLSIVGYAAFEIFHKTAYSDMDTKAFVDELAKGIRSTNSAIQAAIRKILQGALIKDGGAQRAKTTAQLLSYTFSKWYTGQPVKTCRFETFDFGKFDFDPEQVS